MPCRDDVNTQHAARGCVGGALLKSAQDVGHADRAQGICDRVRRGRLGAGSLPKSTSGRPRPGQRSPPGEGLEPELVQGRSPGGSGRAQTTPDPDSLPPPFRGGLLPHRPPALFWGLRRESSKNLQNRSLRCLALHLLVQRSCLAGACRQSVLAAPNRQAVLSTDNPHQTL